MIFSEAIHTQKVELMAVINQQRSDLIKSIYWVGLIQFLAIVGSVVSIVAFMLQYK